MAATKPLIFTGITINGEAYDLHLTEATEVSIEQVTDQVDDGQTLTSAYDVTFSVATYDENIATDANVYSNASASPVKANIVFTGADNAQTLTISNVIVNLNKTFDQNRTAYVLSGSKRAVTIANTVATS